MKTIFNGKIPVSRSSRYGDMTVFHWKNNFANISNLRRHLSEILTYLINIPKSTFYPKVFKNNTVGNGIWNVSEIVLCKAQFSKTSYTCRNIKI